MLHALRAEVYSCATLGMCIMAMERRKRSGTTRMSSTSLFIVTVTVSIRVEPTAQPKWSAKEQEPGCECHAGCDFKFASLADDPPDT